MMRLPAISGLIDRRILANYRVDAGCMASVLPAPFRPQLYHGYAIGGICLIRLKHVRPKFSPFQWGIRSENAAHRIAVEWDSEGQTQHGVYIPRRDTNSVLNSLAGGRIFPGVHHHAHFEAVESENDFSVTMTSRDGGESVHVAGSVGTWNASSVFESLDSASKFFELGSLGYSDAHASSKFDGLELCCKNWNVEALEVSEVRSSYFENSKMFPPGTVEFDCALLMRGIEHEWHGRPNLCCPETTKAR
ncbi:DUF2071 domain-containing protein [Mariniblastus fucicola]|nr:DUF2071 domain-containing protein [Mariniblastus fucicola]